MPVMRDDIAKMVNFQVSVKVTY